MELPVSPRRFEGAFALVEALVALILLSVALAGSAALLVQAVGHERAAGERSRALRHMASLAEALRALRRADGQPLQAVTEPEAEPRCVEVPADCLAESLAAGQIAAWRAAIEADLPAGVLAEVAWVPDPSAAYAVSVSWPAAGPGPGAAVRLMVQP
jgi:Tfp pilus assembly protein PilV